MCLCVTLAHRFPPPSLCLSTACMFVCVSVSCVLVTRFHLELIFYSTPLPPLLSSSLEWLDRAQAYTHTHTHTHTHTCTNREIIQLGNCIHLFRRLSVHSASSVERLLACLMVVCVCIDLQSDWSNKQPKKRCSH